MKSALCTILAGSLTAWALPPVTGLAASDLEKQTKALLVIREAAVDMCRTVESEGGSQTTELSGDVKAKLAGVMAKVADLGIEGAGKYTSTQFRNVLHQDLSKALQGVQDCRLTIFKMLQEKMLTGP